MPEPLTGKTRTQLTRSEALGQAARAYRAGDLDQAEHLCRTILAADADYFDALLLLAMLEHRGGRYDAAVEFATRALQNNRASAEAFALHGLTLRAIGRMDEALASYDQALTLNADLVDALFNRGNVLQALGRNDEALASYDRALSITPRDFQALNNRGIVLFELGRYQEALASYANALAVMPDHAETHNNRGNALLALDFHERALESFDRALAIRPNYAEALNNRGNALQAQGRAEEALATYARAIAVKPDYAEAFSNRAVALLGLARHAEALASCEQALAQRPEYAEALNTRGSALQALNRPEEAYECHAKAFAIRPNSVRALSMGNALQALERYAEALACYDEALAIKPEYVEALNNRGNALQALGRHEEALTNYAKAIALKPNDAEAHWNEGLTRLAMGDYERGWEKYEWRWYNRKLASPQRYREQPAWIGTQDLAAKTILLYPEQGFGDAIQFVRYAAMVKALGAEVLLACHEKLSELFRTVAGVDAVLTPDQALPTFDYHAALMSLPLAFKTNLSTIPAAIPYVKADMAAVDRWRDRFSAYGGRLKVGLAWSGNPSFPGARLKACPVGSLLSLLTAPGTAFFSLQTGEAAAEVRLLNRDGNCVLDLSPELDRFSHTAAAVSALDLVITIDTAVAHLAGALGKEAWILLPFASDWRWLMGREDSPWYPSMRLFRQSRAGDWETVIERVFRALRQRDTRECMRQAPN